MTTHPTPICTIPACRTKIIGGVLVLLCLIAALTYLAYYKVVSGDAVISIFSLLAGAVTVLGVDAYSKTKGA